MWSIYNSRFIFPVYLYQRTTKLADYFHSDNPNHDHFSVKGVRTAISSAIDVGSKNWFTFSLRDRITTVIKAITLEFGGPHKSTREKYQISCFSCAKLTMCNQVQCTLKDKVVITAISLILIVSLTVGLI